MYWDDTWLCKDLFLLSPFLPLPPSIHLSLFLSPFHSPFPPSLASFFASFVIRFWRSLKPSSPWPLKITKLLCLLFSSSTYHNIILWNDASHLTLLHSLPFSYCTLYHKTKDRAAITDCAWMAAQVGRGGLPQTVSLLPMWAVVWLEVFVGIYWLNNIFVKRDMMWLLR